MPGDRQSSQWLGGGGTIDWSLYITTIYYYYTYYMIVKLMNWLDGKFYLLWGLLLLVVFSLLVWDYDEITGGRDYIRDNMGRRWEVRHIGGSEYLYSGGRLVFLRPCRCGSLKRDSL